MAELAARVYPRGVPKPSDTRGLYVGQATDAIIDAVTRLLDLMVRTEDADLLGPLVVDEILIRLLLTPIGARVAQIGEPKSGVHRVAQKCCDCTKPGGSCCFREWTQATRASASAI